MKVLPWKHCVASHKAWKHLCTDSTTRLSRGVNLPGKVLVHPNEDEGSIVCYIPNLISKQQADDLFNWMRVNINWRREVDNFGPQDRLSAYFGDPGCTFAYVGLVLKPQDWPAPLLQVRRQLEARLNGYPLLQGIPCSACLANNYLPGEGHIVWHHDETRAHGPRPLIVSVSLCPDGERPFELRRRQAAPPPPAAADAPEQSLPLGHGSALVMAGATQRHWLHRLPLCGPGAPHRISLTFRSIVPGFEDALAAAAAAAGGAPGMRDCAS